MNKLTKNLLMYAGVLLLFIGLAYGFTPEVFDGKIVNQSDISHWKGMANEAVTYNEAHPDDPTAWTNSMFGGMPTTATIDSFEGDWTDSLYDFLLTGRRPASYLLIALIGGFLLMLALGTGIPAAIGGAIAIAFCSYNFQIIQVGHNTKMQAIAYFPWVLAGVIFTYKSVFAKAENWKGWLPKTILGATLFAFALSMQIKANHVQITYYLAIVIFAFVIGLFIYLCIDKERRAHLKKFFAASALLLTIGLVGIATNANKLIPTYEYSEYTMRGGSELTSDEEGHNQSGLDLKYATEGWSYGIDEMPNLMIPDYNGGSSYGELDKDSHTGRFMSTILSPRDVQTIVKQMPLYHGPQRFTAGPMYMGAISVFLFVLGMLLCKGREKWWLLAATVIAIFLAWGEFFMGFTEFWFKHIPMYSKFRTVSMALIILQVTLPMLGFYVLDRIMKGTYEKKKLFRSGAIALALTAGFCLICILMPSIGGTFSRPEDGNFLTMLFGIPANELHHYGINVNDFCAAIAADRAAVMKADAGRSMLLILIAAALIALPYYIKSLDNVKMKNMLIGCVALVALFDMWSVGKRYLNEEHFTTQKNFTAQYQPREVDKAILKDKDPDYRVLDISGNTFNDAIPSYHHKCIGGYSPVKLQRYQDLIDRYLGQEISLCRYMLGNELDEESVLYILSELKITSLLNGKYIITGKGKDDFLYNPFAYGNCWYVTDFIAAATPDDEIRLLGETDLHTTAIIGDDFKSAQEKLSSNGEVADSTNNDAIYLTEYAPNELIYNFNNENERAAIFSEIYYPKGWKAWIEPAGKYGKVKDGRYQPTADGYPVEIFRADWMLRGAIVPSGEGQLIMRFEPESYKTGENISRISSIILILLLIASAASLAAMTMSRK